MRFAKAFLVSAALALPALALPARANDGFAGLSAAGLQFSQTDAIAMESEELFIGLDRIEVDYAFRNITGQDVTGEVVFPLPPISLWGQLESDWNLPQPAEGNFLNFRAVVDGAEVPIAIDSVAVIEPPWDETQAPGFQYDTPGRDVTADLARLGIPLTTDAQTVAQLLLTFDAAQRDELVRLDLAEFYEGSPGIPEAAYPKWSIVMRYHWTQTFPAGAVVHVRHDYDNRPPGGLFGWQDPPEDYMSDIVDRYCVDAGTSRAMARALRGDDPDASLGVAYYLSYVLRTANSWAGPIGHFRLTLDKGDPGNVISLCVNGIEKTGPTTFVVDKRDYTPESDLEILVVTPFRT